jgi:SPP1 family predicted phage head-tail adaptor
MNPIEQITIQKNYSSGGYGEEENWKTFIQVWAELQIGSGREFFGAKRINAELSGLAWTVQYVRGITSDMRVICSRGTFEITSVIDLRERNKVELQLRQVV